MTSSFAKHDTIDRNSWQSYVDNHELGTIFHTPYMFDVYNSTPNHEPFAYFIVDHGGEIQAMLSGFIQVVNPGVFSCLSKRAILMQSPIYNAPEYLVVLLAYYKKAIGNRVLYTEIRNHCNNKDVHYHYQMAGYSIEDHLNIMVDLTQSDNELWKQVHPKRRNEIRKAEKTGVLVHPMESALLPYAYNILNEVYKRARLPLLPLSFFQNALEKNSINTYMVAYGAFWQDKIIGTMITLNYKRTVYDLFAGSLSAHYNKNPNDIIPWEVFKLSKKNGFEKFDFGGAGKPSVPYGVRDYKLKFGGELVNFGRFSKIHSPIRFKIAVKGFRLTQWMKGRK